MVSLSEYLLNPCGALSIPYWKAKDISVPPNMRIVHERDFQQKQYPNYEDERYFRLLHTLRDCPPAKSQAVELRTIAVCEIEEAVRMINASYTDLQATYAQFLCYTKSRVYAPELWIWAIDRVSQRKMGCAMADFDAETGEISLEWIQVLPGFRRQGVGEALVREILARSPIGARFATVSGKKDGLHSPEKLYRKCGFTGEDVWHVLRRKG